MLLHFESLRQWNGFIHSFIIPSEFTEAKGVAPLQQTNMQPLIMPYPSKLIKLSFTNYNSN